MLSFYETNPKMFAYILYVWTDVMYFEILEPPKVCNKLLLHTKCALSASDWSDVM